MCILFLGITTRYLWIGINWIPQVIQFLLLHVESTASFALWHLLSMHVQSLLRAHQSKSTSLSIKHDCRQQSPQLVGDGSLCQTWEVALGDMELLVLGEEFHSRLQQSTLARLLPLMCCSLSQLVAHQQCFHLSPLAMVGVAAIITVSQTVYC